MKHRITREDLEALRRLDACILANAIETFRQRLRNEGFIDRSVHCLLPNLPPMVGYAGTLKIRGSAPPTTDGPYVDRTDWWDYVVSLPEPRVIVIEDMSTKPGLGSLVGAVHMNILRALGCVESSPTGQCVTCRQRKKPSSRCSQGAWRSRMRTFTLLNLARQSKLAA